MLKIAMLMLRSVTWHASEVIFEVPFTLKRNSQVQNGAELTYLAVLGVAGRG
jgi:hypothetical protein